MGVILIQLEETHGSSNQNHRPGCAPDADRGDSAGAGGSGPAGLLGEASDGRAADGASPAGRRRASSRGGTCPRSPRRLAGAGRPAAAAASALALLSRAACAMAEEVMEEEDEERRRRGRR